MTALATMAMVPAYQRQPASAQHLGEALLLEDPEQTAEGLVAVACQPAIEPLADRSAGRLLHEFSRR
jgi:hypothetical protein